MYSDHKMGVQLWYTCLIVFPTIIHPLEFLYVSEKQKSAFQSISSSVCFVIHWNIIQYQGRQRLK